MEMANEINGTRAVQTKTDILSGEQDLTSTIQWKQTEAWYERLHEPSFGQVSNAEELSASPDGTRIAFTATIWDSLLTSPRRRLHVVDLTKKDAKGDYIVTPVTQGPNNDQKPKWSPDGNTLAFLSDRSSEGHFQLYGLDVHHLGEVHLLTSATLDGVLEDFEWSVDGQSLLIGLAAWGLPKSGFEGSGRLVDSDERAPAWIPSVKTSGPDAHYRSLWHHDLNLRKSHQISQQGRNIWRFAWGPPNHAFALVSNGSSEGDYEHASIVKLSLNDGSETVLRPDDKRLVGELAPTRSGAKIAFVESVGGDRTKLVGSIAYIDMASNENVLLPSRNVDVHTLTWADEGKLLAMGIRGLSSVAIEVDILTKKATELWSSPHACGPSFPRLAFVPERGFAVVRHGWKLAPEIGLVDNSNTYHLIRSWDHAGAVRLRNQLGRSEVVTWNAPDGTEIQGFLYLPVKGSAPYKTILNVHGGPHSAFVDQWMGYRAWVAFLVAHEYAVFNPNPRGSVGRGRDFAAGLIGDFGAIDAHDLLSGLDHLIAKNIVDPDRLGVVGGSYGGYMSAWLTTLTTRFKAAIPISPVNDWKQQWLASDLHQGFLDDEIFKRDSIFEQRSPLTTVHLCKTPTLQLVGTLDNCTPTPQAHYYHTALKHFKVKSVIVEYPLEGHGIRRFPALIDASVRILSWFDTYLS